MSLLYLEVDYEMGKIEGLLRVPAHEAASEYCQKRRNAQQRLLKIWL